MDIEQKLREKLPMENPGPGFTDGVMARVGEAPVWNGTGSVVRISDARARWRSRGILLGTVVAIAAAASIPAFYMGKRLDAPLAQMSATTTTTPVESTSADAAAQMQAATGASSDDEAALNCIDPDVLRGLLLGPTQTLNISDALPQELAAFKAPRQLAWVGAAERGTGAASSGPLRMWSVAAVYRTGLAPDAARIATVGALAAGGWKLQSDGRQFGMNVFSSGNSLPNGEIHCREGKPVTVTASALDDVTYVALSVRRQPEGADFVNACDQPPHPMARPPSMLDQYMPRLELPRDPATGQPVSMRGGGGSNGDVKRRADASFTLKDSADNVARHFARQMAEQGWSTDTNWSGAATAGSTWTLRPDADSILLGAIAVSAFEDGQFTVVFNVVSAK